MIIKFKLFLSYKVLSKNLKFHRH